MATDDTREFRSLLAAVLLQAIADHQDGKYRKDAAMFFKSEGFVWAWEALTENLAGMPRAAVARQEVLFGRKVIGRKAYHARESQ
jgi:hypothetical protein